MKNTRPGGRTGGLVTDIINVRSGTTYMVSTAKEIGGNYWSTGVLFVNEKKFLFGIIKFNLPNIKCPIAVFIRNNINDAHQVHEQVIYVVEYKEEDSWLQAFPRPAPPDGWTDDAKKKIQRQGFYY